MNRAERRKLGIKTSVKTYTLNSEQIEVMKKEVTEKAINKAFFLMLAIPVMVIHDKFGKLMKRDGREEKFVDYCLKLYETYEEGYVSLTDLQQCLYEETGIKMEELKLNFSLNSTKE